MEYYIAQQGYSMQQHYYRDQKLWLEQTSIETIAEQIETPFYCYSQSAIHNAYENYTGHLGSLNAQICYALKANSN
jgi:diaminopimelate decarboxylase